MSAGPLDFADRATRLVAQPARACVEGGSCGADLGVGQSRRTAVQPFARHRDVPVFAKPVLRDAQLAHEFTIFFVRELIN
jgi:hypothetical protein